MENKPVEQNTVESFLLRIFVAVNSLIFLVLFGYSFFRTYVNTDLNYEFPTPKNNNLIINFLGFGLVLLMLFGISRIPDKFFKPKLTWILIGIAALLSCGLSVFWVLVSGAVPQSDQAQLCVAASAFNKGDYSMLGRGGYIAMCPHQLGLVTILRILFGIFGDWNYVAFQIFSAVLVIAIVIGIALITYRLSKSNKITLLSALLTCTCIPVYFYTSFVYGELPSTAFGILALAFFLICFDKCNAGTLIALVLTTGLAVFCRQNTVILAIAMTGVCVVKLFTSESAKRKRVLLILASVLLGLLLQFATLKILYAPHTPADAKGMPSILYIQMGLNSTEGRYGYGWYDHSNLEIYEESNYTPEIAKETANARIREFTLQGKNDPKWMFHFFGTKIVTQWATPMYQGIVMNNYFIEQKQKAAGTWIYENKILWKFFDNYMNLYQLMVYLGAVFAGVIFFKHGGKIEPAVGLIAAFGGFLFSILWEAKARYVFPYLLILIPYAVTGCIMMADALYKAIRKKKKDFTPPATA